MVVGLVFEEESVYVNTQSVLLYEIEKHMCSQNRRNNGRKNKWHNVVDVLQH